VNRSPPTQPLNFYLTQPHDCAYLHDREATTLFADPKAVIDSTLYGRLLERGFRRSGDYFYRPHCSACSDCLSVRLAVNDFTANRSQRRNWRANSDLTVTPHAACYNEQHFELYRRYINTCHAGGGMDNPDANSYRQFLTCSSIDSVFYEFHDNHRLVAVAVIDCLPRGLSSVYTFFDPDLKQRGLGVYAILWSINETRRRNLPWLYLGYWIEACDRMRYKSRYQPLQAYHDRGWRNFSAHS